MKKYARNQKEIRQRQFLLVLPLLVLPFLTLMFWALGAGKDQKLSAQSVKSKGINLHLPNGGTEEGHLEDKMSYYNQAKMDTAKFQAWMKNDPNYKYLPPTRQNDNSPSGIIPKAFNNKVYDNSHNDPKTEQIYQKLADLNREMNKPTRTQTMADGNSITRHSSGSIHASDVDRLERLIQTMNQPRDSEDPELKQLDGLLNKVLEVQHPERMQGIPKQIVDKKNVSELSISSPIKLDPITLLDSGQVKDLSKNGFYALDDDPISEKMENALQAVIHETQTIVDGSTVKLRLLNDLYIKNVCVPKDHFLFGIASLRGERLTIKINSVRLENSLFPVDLSVYDMDGLEGIYIPGAITRDVAKQSADRSLQAIGWTGLDPSIGSQAASAGIEAAKTLVSRKVKLVKAVVKAGYQVLLRDEKQIQSRFIPQE